MVRPIFGTDYLTSSTTTVQTSAFQTAIDAAAAGPGLLLLGHGTFVTGTLTLRPGVVIVGSGMTGGAASPFGIDGTYIKLADGTNGDLFVTQDFATLTGQNKWLVSDGVPTRFGLRNMTLDGNRDNNTSGWPLRIYGKRYILDDLEVLKGASGGIYSECSFGISLTGVGEEPITNPDDGPEATIGTVYVRQTNGIGILYRGPHDGRMERLFIDATVGNGMEIRQSNGVYNGACEIGQIHVYGCENGLVADTNFRCETLITESNDRSGLVTADRATIGMLVAYRNQLFNGGSQVAQDAASIYIGSRAHIGNAFINATFGGTGVIVAASAPSPVQFGNLSIVGQATGGLGLDIRAGRVSVANGEVSGFSANGGIGVSVGSVGVPVDETHLRLHVGDCKTGFVDVAGGDRNRWSLTVTPGAGQTAYTLSGANSDVSGTDNIVDILVDGADARSFRPTIRPSADDTHDLGGAVFRWRKISASQNIQLYAAQNDAEPVVNIDTAGLKFGAGGASATDVLLSRSAADSLYTPDVMIVPVLRLLPIDHWPPTSSDTPTGTLTNGDAFYSVASGTHRIGVYHGGSFRSVTLT